MKKATEATKDQASRTTTATEPKAAKAKKATPAPATDQNAPQSVAPAKVEKPAKAAKIVRRITGRVRLCARVLELVPAKK